MYLSCPRTLHLSLCRHRQRKHVDLPTLMSQRTPFYLAKITQRKHRERGHAALLDRRSRGIVHGGVIPELGEQPEAGKRVSGVTTIWYSGSRCLSRRTRELGNATKKSPTSVAEVDNEDLPCVSVKLQ